jgi:hypothetical protein
MGNVSSSRSRSNSSPGLLQKIKDKALKNKSSHNKNNKSKLRPSSTTSSFSDSTISSGGGGGNDSSLSHSDDLNINSPIKKTSLDITEKKSRASRNRRNTTNDLSSFANVVQDPISLSEFKKFFAENYIDTYQSRNKNLKKSNSFTQREQLTRPMSLKPKTNPIYEDYVISKTVLGLGISGKVLGCVNKQTKQKYALKTLRESVKAKREIDLHWRACQSCPYIVQIVDVYENTINTQKVILVVMEW